MNAVAAWITDRLPPDEDLDRTALSDLVTAIGGAPGLWQELVRHGSDRGLSFELYRDVHVETWLLHWLSQQDTGFHDHDSAAGAVYVVEGVLVEDSFSGENATVGEAGRERRAGTVFSFNPSYIHRMRNLGGDPATSIHAYSPARRRTTHYEPDLRGSLRKRSVEYDDGAGDERFC